MRWKEGETAYYMESDAGYYISKSFDGERVFYTAWAPRIDRRQPNCLSIHPSPIDDHAARRSARNAAQNACDAHFLEMSA